MSSEKLDLKPIKIRENGDARVAYDLMLVIAQAEANVLSTEDSILQSKQEKP